MSGFGAFRVVRDGPKPGQAGIALPPAGGKREKPGKEKRKKKRSKRSDSCSSSSSSSSGSSSSSSEVLKKKRRKKLLAESSSSSSSDSPAPEPRRAQAREAARKSTSSAQMQGPAEETEELSRPAADDCEFDRLLGRTSKDLGTLRKEAKPQPPKAAVRELNPYWALNRTGLPEAAAEAQQGNSGRLDTSSGGPPHRRDARATGERQPGAAGQFGYMGRWQPAGEASPGDGDRKPRGRKKETVYFEKEASNYKVEELERDKFLETKQSKLIDYKKMNAQRLKHDCWFCLDSIKADKRLVAALGNRVYLALPARGALCEGHCLIIPMDHRVSARDFDSEELLEVRNFKKSLIRMFDATGRTPVFMETVLRLRQFRHTYIECIPVASDDAEIFFYNELDRAENEFRTSSKRVIRTQGGSLQSALPEGFAYFHVGFGVDRGLLHLIEDEAGWNPNFGRDIAGGLLGADTLGRTPRSTATQEALKMADFLAAYRPFDWTAALAGGDH